MELILTQPKRTVLFPISTSSKISAQYFMHVSKCSSLIVSIRNEILQELPNIEDGIGSPEWRLSLCLAFSWLIIYLSISRGVKTMGKVAYVTCIFPSIVLVILLIIGLTLPGAWSGIRFFMEPKWDLLYQPKVTQINDKSETAFNKKNMKRFSFLFFHQVWYNAAGQCFFSLNTGLGAIIMFASYNKFSHNIYRCEFACKIWMYLHISSPIFNFYSGTP